MLKNYIKIAWRSLRTNKLLSFINIAGLAVGMAVVMLIGLWVWDETSYNKNFDNYDHITRVMQSIHGNKDRGLSTQRQVPMPLADELRNLYGNDFQQVILSTAATEHVIGLGDKKITQTGRFMEPAAADMLSLKMLAGSREALQAPQNILLSIAKIEPVFKRFDPGEPFNYKFADDEYDAKFRSEQRIGSLASFFTVLAVFISCLGLFGMAAFVTERRTKEVDVRKVLGASVVSLWGLLSREFVLLVGLSVLIATPIAWYAMNSWLQNYAYRARLDWWIFALTGGSALLIALLTISYQVLKAANANPARNLRTE